MRAWEIENWQNKKLTHWPWSKGQYILTSCPASARSPSKFLIGRIRKKRSARYVAGLVCSES